MKFPRPRFSLRTLLILSLLIGSAGGLWFHWEPWTVTRLSSNSLDDLPVFSADSRQLAGYSGSLHVWDTSSGAVRCVLGTYSYGSPVFSADGQYLTFSGLDDAQTKRNTIEVWSIPAAKRLIAIDTTSEGSAGRPHHAYISPDGQYVLGQAHASVHCWSLKDRRKLFSIRSHFRLRADPETDAERRAAEQIQLIRNEALAADQLRRFCQLEENGRLGVYAGPSDDARRIFTFLPGTSAVQLWDAATGRKIRTLGLPRVAQAMRAFWFSEDGRHLALQPYPDACTLLLDMETGAPPIVLPEDLGGADRAAFSADGNWFSMVRRHESVDTDFLLTAWDTRTGKARHVHENAAGRNIFFSPDGQRCVAIGNAGTWVLDMSTGQKIYRLLESSPEFFARAAFSPDGRHLAVTDQQGALLFCSRRRPEYWWGIAWLPEFWLAVVFGGVVAWSLHRDWRELRKKSSTRAGAAV